MKYSCVIIGGGIVGCSIFSKLARSGVSVALIEKGEDVALGATKANSGIIHAGYDCQPNTLKAKLNVKGNEMFEEEAQRLGEKIDPCGSLVVARANEYSKIEELYNRGMANGVKNMEIIKRDEILKIVPNISEDIEFALFARTAKIISPYSFCIAYAEEAVLNGGKLFLNSKVQSAKFVDGKYDLTLSGGEQISADFVINCAGAGVNEVSQLFGAEQLPVKLVKGEYILLDKDEKFTTMPIFPLPTAKGKGILVLPTVAGNTAFGPTAVEIDSFETAVSPSGVASIKDNVKLLIKNVNYRKVIKLYAGVRVKIGEDFYIKFSDSAANYLFVAGICSPGLSSAPAIVDYVLDLLKQKGLKTQTIQTIKRQPYIKINTLTTEEINRLIAKDESFGRVICRCENITEGEIKQVLNGPIKPLTTDGVKRRLRTTMGRCQGSFCYPSILDIMSKHYGCEFEQIKFKGNASTVSGDIKEGGIYD